MSGAKETPRQKMIGMMYLVLTALLALNVSKQIVAAFITLNDKLDLSASNIDNRIDDTYIGFDQKGATLKAERSDLAKFNLWQAKAIELKKNTAELIGFLLGECNEMIKLAEGEDWIEEKDADGNISKLKSLDKIENMDDYDIPTNLFVGGNPNSPETRGLEIVNQIHKYRDQIAESMGTYMEDGKSWSFIAPENLTGLSGSLKSANPKDTASLSRFFKTLTIPEFLPAHGEDIELPWVSVTFDHAPIVAAAAMFTSLKLDVKSAQAFASDYMLRKIEVDPFIFNKIEPLAFANSGYINQGDSLGLNIMIAAFDSNNVASIRWGMDGDTIPERWSETNGRINLSGSQPGNHIVKGAISVKQGGVTTWKSWKFDYTVGQPVGMIGQPEMRVLYRNYDNILEGVAAGYPAENVTLVSGDCSLSRNGDKWIASVGSGISIVKIGVRAKNADGTTVSLGVFDYKVKSKPRPTLYFGTIADGDNPSMGTVNAQVKFKVDFDPSVILRSKGYKIIGGDVVVTDVITRGKVNADGTLDAAAKRIIKQSSGKEVTISVRYVENGNNTIYKTGMRFYPK